MSAGRCVYSQIIQARIGDVIKPSARCNQALQVDLPYHVNLPLSDALKQKLEAPSEVSGGVGEKGCADASLYTRFSRAGLSELRLLPQLATLSGELLQNRLSRILSSLNATETEALRAAVRQGEANGIFFVAQPFHCAVGTKPT